MDTRGVSFCGVTGMSLDDAYRCGLSRDSLSEAGERATYATFTPSEDEELNVLGFVVRDARRLAPQEPVWPVGVVYLLKGGEGDVDSV